MIAAYRALAAGKRDVALRPWLFRIAHNESLRVRRGRLTQAEPSEMDWVSGMEAAPHERAELREDVAVLWRDMAHLPAEPRSALVLRELSGLSHDAIAAVLTTSQAHVKQLIYEARQSLLEFRQGREAACGEVRRRLSDGDGRILRGRRVQAHLRACGGRRDFRAALSERPRQLASFAPVLPVAVAGRILSATVGSGGAGSAALAGSWTAAAGGGASAATVGVKVAVVVAAAITGGALVVLPHGSDDPAPSRPAAAHSGASVLPPVGAAGPRVAAAHRTPIAPPAPLRLARRVAIRDTASAATRSAGAGGASGSLLAGSVASPAPARAEGIPSVGGAVAPAADPGPSPAGAIPGGADPSPAATAGDGSATTGVDASAVRGQPAPQSPAPRTSAGNASAASGSGPDDGLGDENDGYARARGQGAGPAHGGTPPGQGGTPPGQGAT